MRALLTLSTLGALAACSGGSPAVVGFPDPHGLDAGQQTSGCLSDSACGEQQVCVNCAGVGACTPGCRDASQCPAGNICQLGTVCQTCPCPPGWCIIDPCRDDDSDGYAATSDPTVTCPGKQKADCDDRDPTVHPGAEELCGNYKDDNCDNKYDERDPACVCGGGAARCNTTWDCGTPGIDSCEKGCCTKCSMSNYDPQCAASGYCTVTSGVNTNGCSWGSYCISCGGCSNADEPVCGRNGATYRNACLAARALGTSAGAIQHTGACVPGEGVACSGVAGADGGCGPSGQLYCRDTCPQGTSCGPKLCGKLGGCAADSDCPAGLTAPDCDGGLSAASCVSGACVFSCR